MIILLVLVGIVLIAGVVTVINWVLERTNTIFWFALAFLGGIAVIMGYLVFCAALFSNA